MGGDVGDGGGTDGGGGEVLMEVDVREREHHLDAALVVVNTGSD